MNRGHCFIAPTLTVFLLMGAGSVVRAETQWAVDGGKADVRFANGNLATVGVHITIGAQGLAPGLETGDANVSPASTQLIIDHLAADYDVIGEIHVVDAIVIERSATRLTLDGYVIRFVPGRRERGLRLEIAPDAQSPAWFSADDLKVKLDPNQPAWMVETGSLVITKHLASLLGDAALFNRMAGAAEIIARVQWLGGDAPVLNETGDNGTPRAPTICPGEPGAATGPDVIVGVLSDVASWGTETIGGVPIAAFSVGTISCNLGNVGLNWIAGSVGGTENRHPVIAQNLFRLKTLPDGSSRIEQIGQSWLKHGFTALTNEDCCVNCTGSGGSVLPVGCSDPYGAGLNGGQSSAGPKNQVNAFTGVHIHPIVGPAFSGEVARRLQVKTSDLDPTQNGGGLYFVEGQYNAADDAAAGNQRNNTSYRRVVMNGSGNSWTMELTAEPTQRQEAGIRAWKDTVPDVIETDVNIPNEGLVILAARATPAAGGLWHYEYAVQNICSDRSIGSFTVPVSNPATLSNIEFHDVDYHSGEPYSGTDWPSTYAGGQVEWATTPFATNSNANALRWGTLYNFRFDANAEPATGEVTLGVFKPGAPTSVTATTVVPGNLVALAVSVTDPVPQLVSPCTSITLGAQILPGSQNLVPGSAKVHYRFDGGAFTEQTLTSLGGNNYEFTIPAAPCGSAPEFYVQAEGDGGATVSAPLNAPTNKFTYSVGVPESGVLLDVNFDSGLPGGWTASGLWNVTTSCAVSPACGSGSFAYYGNVSNCNYATGNAPNSGVLSAPSLTLPTTGTISLSYCSNFETENFQSFDLGRVTVNGAAVDTLVQTPAWETRTVDLTAFAGQTVTLAFEFDTVDGQFNNFHGWQIDNVHITGDNVVCFAPIRGDMNNDDLVDGDDVQLFTGAVLAESTVDNDVCRGDFDLSGVVELGDVAGMVDALLVP